MTTQLLLLSESYERPMSTPTAVGPLKCAKLENDEIIPQWRFYRVRAIDHE